MQKLRYHGTGRNDALRAIPEWPARTDTTATRAPALLAQSGAKGIDGMIAMEFVAKLARHIVGCPRCQHTGRWDTATPESWLLWALGKKPQLAAIIRPVLAEMRAGAVPKLPPGRG